MLAWTACLVLPLVLAGCRNREQALELELKRLETDGRNRAIVTRVHAELEKSAPRAALYFWLTKAYYDLDDLPKTKEYAQLTLKLDPAHEWAARFFLIACRDAENYDEGIAFGETWVAANPKAGAAYKDLALICDSADQAERAYGHAREGYRRLPKDTRVAAVYFYFACSKEDPKETLRAAEEWARANVAIPYFWAQLGKGLVQAREHQLAQPILRRALEEGSDDESVPRQLLACFRALKDAAGLRAFVAEYSATHETDLSFRNTHGAALYECGEYAEALAVFRENRRRDGNSTTLAMNIVYTQVALENASEAIAEGERWRARPTEPLTAGFHHSLGNAYFARRRYLDAELQYREGLMLQPASRINAYGVVLSLMRQNNPSHALQFGRSWAAEHRSNANQDFDELLARAKAAAGGE